MICINCTLYYLVLVLALVLVVSISIRIGWVTPHPSSGTTFPPVAAYIYYVCYLLNEIYLLYLQDYIYLLYLLYLLVFTYIYYITRLPTEACIYLLYLLC